MTCVPFPYSFLFPSATGVTAILPKQRVGGDLALKSDPLGEKSHFYPQLCILTQATDAL